MKKVYLLLSALCVAGGTMAQVPFNKVAPAKKSIGINEMPVKSVNQIQAKATTLWTNDFSNPSDWSMTNTSSPATDWVITTNQNAAPVAAFQPAGFASAANGFAIIDSDAQGQNGSQDAFLTLVAPITACASEPIVVLRFSQMHRRYLETTEIQVSNDNVNWTSIDANPGMNANTNTTNPALVSVDISAVAGNQANVYLRFHYVGAWDWFWAIDDVELVVPDDFDLAGQGVHWGVEGPWGLRLPIVQMPNTQIQPIKVGGIVKNVGGQTQSDIVVNGVIPSTYSGASAQGTLAPFELDTFDLTTDFTPAGNGTYTIDMSLTSGATDANPADNTLPSVTVDVQDYLYSRTGNVQVGNAYNGGDGFDFGNVVDIFNNQTVYSIDVFVDGNTPAQTEIFATLYGFDSNDEFQYLDQSELYLLQPSDIGTWVTLRLQNPVALVAGESYVPCASYSGGATTGLVIGTAGVSEPQTTFIYDIPTATWFFSTSTVMVRMNFKNDVGIEELDDALALNMYPNPAKEEVTISFNNNNEEAVISILDLSGKVVKTVGANAAQTVVNVADLQAGVYVVRVVAGNKQSTQKLTIN